MTVNIINPEAINTYLQDQAGGNEAVAKWLISALGKSLKKREESAMPVTALPPDAPEWLVNKWDVTDGAQYHSFKPDAALDDKIRHICDWLISEEQNSPGAIAKQPPLDLEGAYNAADKYFEKLNQKLAHTFEDDADTKTIITFPDGSRIVQLLTPNALRYEGPKMGHCIGGGGYDQSLLDGSYVFYSLRDKNNEPHVTFHVEVEGNVLRQCKGKENKPPVTKYMPYVHQFVTQQQFELEESASHTGLMRDDQGRYHSIYNLPNHLSVKGSVDLEGCTELRVLPDHFSVEEGYLILDGCIGLTALPDNLSVEADLSLRGTSITSMPRSNRVGGKIYVDKLGIFNTLGIFKTVDEAADAFDEKYRHIYKWDKKSTKKASADPAPMLL